jgi:predicted GNAT family N-acyltransferase
MIIYKTASTSKELEQILTLQKANLPDSLSCEEKEKEGFLTVIHNFELLKRMNDICPHIIAKDGNKLAGYALCMHPKFESEIDVLKSMFAEIKLSSETKYIGNFIVMGQICVNKDYRKQGVFRKLYKTMQDNVTPEFTSIITEIDARNNRSVQAHLAIGFKVLSIYNADGKDWKLIYLK